MGIVAAMNARFIGRFIGDMAAQPTAPIGQVIDFKLISMVDGTGLEPVTPAM